MPKLFKQRNATVKTVWALDEILGKTLSGYFIDEELSALRSGGSGRFVFC